MAKGIKTGGRQKGSGNVLTRDVKEAIITAWQQVGGIDWFVGLAHEDPKTFAGLVKTVVPLAISGDPDNPIKHEHRLKLDFSGRTDRQLSPEA